MMLNFDMSLQFVYFVIALKRLKVTAACPRIIRLKRHHGAHREGNDYKLVADSARIDLSHHPVINGIEMRRRQLVAIQLRTGIIRVHGKNHLIHHRITYRSEQRLQQCIGAVAEHSVVGEKKIVGWHRGYKHLIISHQFYLSFVAEL